MRRGTLDASVVGIANIVPFVKKLGVLTLPYMFDNLDDAVKGTNGAAHELLNGYAVKEGGFQVVCWTYTDFRWSTNSKRPIISRGTSAKSFWPSSSPSSSSRSSCAASAGP